MKLEKNLNIGDKLKMVVANKKTEVVVNDIDIISGITATNIKS